MGATTLSICVVNGSKLKHIICIILPLAGEVLAQALPYLERNIHPIVIIAAFKQALEDAIEIVDNISIPVNINDPKEMLELVKTSIGTKFVSRWSDMMCNLALDAVRCVAVEVDGRREVDIKRYARIEKVSPCFPFICSIDMFVRLINPMQKAAQKWFLSN